MLKAVTAMLDTVSSPLNQLEAKSETGWTKQSGSKPYIAIREAEADEAVNETG